MSARMNSRLAVLLVACAVWSLVHPSAEAADHATLLARAEVHQAMNQVDQAEADRAAAVRLGIQGERRA